MLSKLDKLVIQSMPEPFYTKLSKLDKLVIQSMPELFYTNPNKWYLSTNLDSKPIAKEKF